MQVNQQNLMAIRVKQEKPKNKPKNKPTNWASIARKLDQQKKLQDWQQQILDQQKLDQQKLQLSEDSLLQESSEDSYSSEDVITTWNKTGIPPGHAGCHSLIEGQAVFDPILFKDAQIEWENIYYCNRLL